MKNLEEIWRDVKGYEGLYQVSSMGRIKSLGRVVTRSDGRIQTFKERVLKASLSNNGYMNVGLCRNSVAKSHMVHQLVAAAFLGHKPSGYEKVVNHIDNNKTNNNANNLELVSQRHNTSVDKWRHDTASKYVGVSLDGYLKNGSPRWQARIRIDKKLKYLGVFRSEESAAEAYQTALKQIS